MEKVAMRRIACRVCGAHILGDATLCSVCGARRPDAPPKSLWLSSVLLIAVMAIAYIVWWCAIYLYISRPEEGIQ